MVRKKIHYGFPNPVNGLWTGAVCGNNGEFITDVKEQVNCKRCIRTFSIMSLPQNLKYKK